MICDFELSDRVNKDIGEKKIISIVCECSIEYSGRSKSQIGTGHRIILIKQDSTLLIHGLSGYKPINWMSPPMETVAEFSEELLLYSQRTKKPFEEMRIRVHKVLNYQAYSDLRDGSKLSVTHTEKDLQDYLVKNQELVHPSFRLRKAEYSTPLGYFDLYGKVGDTYVVVELKAERAGLPAALQIKRYTEWLKEHVNPARGILVAPSITPNAMLILNKAGIEYKKIDIKKIEVKHRKEKTLNEWC